jgi:NhaP-type Na+/H+ or K+/H+ antiporter
VTGTAATALGVAVLAYLVFGFDWRGGLVVGVALAPTDPAVVFSVLGRREISGRSGTLLEGESGANDPVGIAAMAALLAAGGSGGHAAAGALGEFAVQMAVGAAVGVAGGWLLSLAMQRMPLPSGALYPLQTLLGAGAIYGAATAAHGSGFLAVFVAGFLVGDLRTVQGRHRTVPLVAGQPGGDRGLHDAGVDGVAEVIIVVVAFSVIVQGGLVPTVARWTHVPMRVVEPEQWALGMRFREEPSGLRPGGLVGPAPSACCWA